MSQDSARQRHAPVSDELLNENIRRLVNSCSTVNELAAVYDFARQRHAPVSDELLNENIRRLVNSCSTVNELAAVSDFARGAEHEQQSRRDNELIQSFDSLRIPPPCDSNRVEPEFVRTVVDIVRIQDRESYHLLRYSFYLMGTVEEGANIEANAVNCISIMMPDIRDTMENYLGSKYELNYVDAPDIDESLADEDEDGLDDDQRVLCPLNTSARMKLLIKFSLFLLQLTKNVGNPFYNYNVYMRSRQRAICARIGIDAPETGNDYFFPLQVARKFYVPLSSAYNVRKTLTLNLITLSRSRESAFINAMTCVVENYRGVEMTAFKIVHDAIVVRRNPVLYDPRVMGEVLALSTAYRTVCNEQYPQYFRLLADPMKFTCITMDKFPNLFVLAYEMIQEERPNYYTNFDKGNVRYNERLVATLKAEYQNSEADNSIYNIS